MNLHGWCTSCRRFRRVQVSAQELAFVAARVKPMVEGLCDECREEQLQRSRARLR